MIGAGVRTTIWKAMRHYAVGDDVACLRGLLPAGLVPNQRQADALLRELARSPELLAAVDTPESRRFDQATPSLDAATRLEHQLALGGAGRGRAVLLYMTARILKPETVIETGCFTGWDSAVLLHALDRNGSGHLYTVDLPAREGQFSQHGRSSGLPGGLRPGFLVPMSFRDRWTFIEGNVRTELMPLLDRLDGVGLFLHDSEHTYAHMMWEYAAVLPHMLDGGVIVSDDIAWNTAFWDFAAATGRRCVIHRSNPNVGALAVRRAA
ncbi:MAG: class I SAM-dependent methyltransferase [Chloroflexi bacterium]|nr:class I SAM-dependent methyltransferase [Chloroflexota bacterium]